jgi:hypothetical protein
MQFVRKPLQSPLSHSWCGGGGVVATDLDAAVFQILQPSGCGQQCDRVRAFFCVARSKAEPQATHKQKNYSEIR